MSSSLAPSLHKPKTAVCVNFFRNIDDPCQKIRTRYPVEQRIDIGCHHWIDIIFREWI